MTRTDHKVLSLLSRSRFSISLKVEIPVLSLFGCSVQLVGWVASCLFVPGRRYYFRVDLVTRPSRTFRFFAAVPLVLPVNRAAGTVLLLGRACRSDGRHGGPRGGRRFIGEQGSRHRCPVKFEVRSDRWLSRSRTGFAFLFFPLWSRGLSALCDRRKMGLIRAKIKRWKINKVELISYKRSKVIYIVCILG